MLNSYTTRIYPQWHRFVYEQPLIHFLIIAPTDNKSGISIHTVFPAMQPNIISTSFYEKLELSLCCCIGIRSLTDASLSRSRYQQCLRWGHVGADMMCCSPRVVAPSREYAYL